MSMPMLTALVQALFYLYMTPVSLAILVDGSAGLRVGTGVSAFVRWRARRQAARKLASGGGGGPGAGRVLRVLCRARFEAVSLSGRVALKDAAATALACGAIGALASCLRGRTAALYVAVTPDFSNDFHLELRGMLTARAGKLLTAAFIAEKGRMSIWKSIPSKT